MLAAVTSAVLLVSCVAPKPAPPSTAHETVGKPTKKEPRPSLLPSREAAAWREKASRIQSGQVTIYYYGTAQEEAGATPERWAGTVTGDIYVITPNARTVIPKGKFRLAPDGTVSVSGASETVLMGYSGD
jgi:hypothetical protein